MRSTTADQYTYKKSLDLTTLKIRESTHSPHPSQLAAYFPAIVPDLYVWVGKGPQALTVGGRPLPYPLAADPHVRHGDPHCTDLCRNGGDHLRHHHRRGLESPSMSHPMCLR